MMTRMSSFFWRLRRALLPASPAVNAFRRLTAGSMARKRVFRCTLTLHLGGNRWGGGLGRTHCRFVPLLQGRLVAKLLVPLVFLAKPRQ
jgi:hypothetical protein